VTVGQELGDAFFGTRRAGVGLVAGMSDCPAVLPTAEESCAKSTGLLTTALPPRRPDPIEVLRGVTGHEDDG